MEKDTISFVFAFSLITVIVLSVSLIVYVAFHDLAFIQLNNLADDLVASGDIDQKWITETAIEVLENTPEVLDLIWFISFIMLYGSLIVSSYFTRRMDQTEIIAWLVFGIPILLFLSSLVFQATDWLRLILIDGVLANLDAPLKWSTFYLTNYGLLNAILLVSCLIANFVDIDLSKFNSRKEKEFNEIGGELG